ncbi:MAG: metal-sensitive transcriptional regulator [Sedimentisphaeraceae bacterium JB056]
MNPDHTENIVALKRIEGQIRGLQRMIEESKYCIDILTQIQAVKGALGSIEKKILAKHFHHCVSDAMNGTSEEEKETKIQEILKLIDKTRR